MNGVYDQHHIHRFGIKNRTNEILEINSVFEFSKYEYVMNA